MLPPIPVVCQTGGTHQLYTIELVGRKLSLGYYASHLGNQKNLSRGYHLPGQCLKHRNIFCKLNTTNNLVAMKGLQYTDLN